MRWSAVVAMLFASIAWGQYSGLATPYDGSVVYFTSNLAFKGSNQPNYGKLFSADQTGVRLVRSLPDLIPTPPQALASCALGGFYAFSSVETSSDGTNVFGGGTMSSSGWCYETSTAGTYWISPAGDQQLPEAFRVSPDGRHGIANLSPRDALMAYVDVATGNLTAIYSPQPGILGEFPIFGSGRTIANDGTAIFMLLNAPFLVRPGSDAQAFPVSNAVALYAIDATASNVLYGRASSLRLYNLQSGQDTLVLSDASQTVWAAMSDNAQTILVLRAGQAWVVQADGAGLRQITTDPDGIVNVALSGDGKVVYAATNSGRMLKIDAGTGNTTELIGRTPSIAEAAGPYYPGFPGTIYLTGLPVVSQGSPDPPGLSVAGTTITVAGIAAPVLFVTPDHIDFLVPWNAIPPNVTPYAVPILAGVSGDNTPFDEPQTMISIWNTPFVTAIAHQDWSGPVTDSSPPHAGEVLHFFMISLGAVSPEVQPGAPAPSSEPLARLATPLQCSNWTVLFAGLAPGATWRLYQVDLQLGSATGEVTSSCSLDGGKTWFAMSFLKIMP